MELDNSKNRTRFQLSSLSVYCAILVALSLSACSSKPNDLILPHKPASEINEDNTRTGISAAEARELLYSININAITDNIQNFSIADHREKSFAVLKNLFLNIEFLEDPYKNKLENEIPKALWAFQYSALKIIDQSTLSENESEKIEGKALLRKLVRLYTYGCEAPDWRGCKFLPFFAQDTQTAEVILRFIETNHLPVDLYYDYLHLAHSVPSQLDRPKLRRMIVNRALERIESFMNVTIGGEECPIVRIELRDRSVASKQRLADFIRYVTLNLSNLQSIENNPLDQEFLKKLFLWVSSGNLRKILGTSFAEEINTVISKNLKSQSLWPLFTDAFLCTEQLGLRKVQILRSDETDLRTQRLELASSYSEAVWDTKFFNPSAFETLNVTPINFLENGGSQDDLIYLYIVSELFRMEPVQKILPYWEATSKDKAKISAIMDSFVRVHLVHNAILTNKHMSYLYEDVKSGKIHASRFLVEIRNSSFAKVTPLWMEYYRAVDNIKQFFEGEVDNRLEDESNSAGADSFRNLLENLHLNVKYLVTYPNMLMLAYFANLYKYKERIYIQYFNTWATIDDKLILQEFLNGTLPPLFKFTNYRDDQKSLDAVEVMYSVYFATRLNLFSLYKVDPKDWFKRFVESYIANGKPKLREIEKRLRDQFNQGGYLEQFSEICQNVESFRSGANNTKSILTQIPIATASKYTFHGRFGQQGVPQIKMGNVLGASGDMEKSVAEALEFVRSDFDPKLNTILLLRSVFTRTAEAESNANLLEAIQVMESELREAKWLRNSIISSSLKLEEQISNCMLTLDREEHIRQTEIFQMEMKFLEYAYLALDALNTMEHQGKTISELRADYPTHQLWRSEFYEGLDQFSNLYEGLESILVRRSHYPISFGRIAGYQENFAGLLQERNSRYFLSYRSMDMAVRFAHFIKHGFDQQTVSLQADQIEIAYPATYKEFFQIFVNYQFDIARSTGALSYLPRKDRSYSENVSDFQRGGMLHIASEDTNSFRNWTQYFGLFTTVGATGRRILQTKVAAHRMKYEMELDPAERMNCDEECVQATKESMQNDSLNLLTYAKKLGEHTSIGGLTDADLDVLNLFDAATFYSIHEGPTFLFLESEGGHYITMPLGDDLYTYLSAYSLGDRSTFRGIRKSAETSSSNIPNGDSSMSEVEFAKRYISPRINFWTQAERFAPTLKRQDEELVLYVEPTVLSQINESFTWRIKSEIRQLAAFEDALPTFQSDYLQGAKPLWFSLGSEPFHHDYLLRDSLRADVHTQIRSFNDLTHGFFLPEEYRSDFKWGSRAAEAR